MRVHRQTKARPIDRHAEERPHLIPLPAQPFDASEVVYRTVDAEGFVVYRQNFYAAPWRLIGQSVAVRVTENELVIHDRAFVEATRHPLFPRRRRGPAELSQQEHEPPRDAQRRSEQLAAAIRRVRRGGHAVPGGPARRQPVRQEPGRTRPGAGGGVPACGRPGGAGAGRAVRRLQPVGGAAHPRGAGPAQDTAGRAGRRPPHLPRPALDGEPTPPRPTSDYQALLGEDPHDAEATDPEPQAGPEPPNPGDEGDGVTEPA